MIPAAEARLLVSEGAVLSPGEAATILGLDDDGWLRDQDLVLSLAVGDVLVERVVWRQVLARLEHSVDLALVPAPLKTWRDVAIACGVSEDTLGRRRREREDETPPYFEDASEAQAWYRELLRPPNAAKPRRKRGAVSTGGPTLADRRKTRG